jgi:hypothetical protein
MKDPRHSAGGKPCLLKSQFDRNCSKGCDPNGNVDLVLESRPAEGKPSDPKREEMTPTDPKSAKQQSKKFVIR